MKLNTISIAMRSLAVTGVEVADELAVLTESEDKCESLAVNYNHHDNINSVRRMVAASENNDSEKMFSFFDEKANFRDVNMPDGEWSSLDEYKERLKKFRESFEINSIDVVGYPDYLEYDMNNSKVVQSWWDFRVKRKSDGKKVTIPVMLVHNFNDDGMITNEMGYYTTQAMAAK